MIQSVRLQHFRSYKDDSFEFDPGVNIIVGPNASGKTNLLEALLVTARGNSYRTHDGELIHFGQPWARLDAIVDGQSRIVKLVAEPTSKSYDLGGRAYARLSLEKTLPVVLFEPNDLLLLTGSPDKRRDYADDLLAQTTPGYSTTVRAYKRTLAQRNRLLKSGHAPESHLFPWDVRLSELGARVVRARTDIIQQLNIQVSDLYKSISASDTNVTVSYRAAAVPDQYESIMLHQLEHRRQDDILRGFTSFGPHRDDIEITFDGQPAADVASRGEMRTLVLALKILELHILEAKRGDTPLLLLDDVFSELDGARRKALTEHLQPYQTFITTTDADVVAHHFAGLSNVILLTKD